MSCRIDSDWILWSLIRTVFLFFFLMFAFVQKLRILVRFEVWDSLLFYYTFAPCPLSSGLSEWHGLPRAPPSVSQFVFLPFCPLSSFLSVGPVHRRRFHSAGDSFPAGVPQWINRIFSSCLWIFWTTPRDCTRQWCTAEVLLSRGSVWFDVGTIRLYCRTMAKTFPLLSLIGFISGVCWVTGKLIPKNKNRLKHVLLFGVT